MNIRSLAVAVCLYLALTGCSRAAGSEWNIVVDFSTTGTLGGAEGIAYQPQTDTLMAVNGDVIYELDIAGTLIRSYLLQDDPKPRLRGVDALPTGGLLAVADNTCRLYEITPAGTCIAVKPIDANTVAGGVTYSRWQRRVLVVDTASSSIHEYSSARHAEKTTDLNASDVQGIETPAAGIVWILDCEQNKVLRRENDGVVAEFIDLEEICKYDGAEGLALDGNGGVLFVCFDESQRIIGIDVSHARDLPSLADVDEAAPIHGDGETSSQSSPPPAAIPPAPIQQSRPTRRYDPLQTGPVQNGGGPSQDGPIQTGPARHGQPPTLAPAQLGQRLDFPRPRGSTPRIQPSPHPSSTIVVRPPQAPTIYVLPIIIRDSRPATAPYSPPLSPMPAPAWCCP